MTARIGEQVEVVGEFRVESVGVVVAHVYADKRQTMLVGYHVESGMQIDFVPEEDVRPIGGAA